TRFRVSATSPIRAGDGLVVVHALQHFEQRTLAGLIRPDDRDQRRVELYFLDAAKPTEVLDLHCDQPHGRRLGTQPADERDKVVYPKGGEKTWRRRPCLSRTSRVPRSLMARVRPYASLSATRERVPESSTLRMKKPTRLVADPLSVAGGGRSHGPPRR